MNLKYLFIPGVIYGLPNVVAFFVFLYFGVLLVDTIPVVLALSYEVAFGVFAVFSISYGLVFYVSYKCSAWFVPNRAPKVSSLLGIFIFLVQAFTFCVVLFFDFGKVGAKDVQVNVFVLLASYLKADFLFLIYYGNVRSSRVPWVNIVLYIISNVLRGWSSVWMVVILVEVYCYMKSKGGILPYAKLGAFFIVVMAIFPWVNNIKESIRGDGEVNLGYVESYFKLFNRLQHISDVVLIAQESAAIHSAVASGAVLPWYMCNSFLANMTGSKGDPLQRYITKEYLLDRGDGLQYGDESSWYTHIGVSGWIFVVDWFEMPFYIIFVFFLLVVPYKLASMYIKVDSMIPVLHVASFVYVLHGWMEVQLQFIFALMVYIIIAKIFADMGRYLSLDKNINA